MALKTEDSSSVILEKIQQCTLGDDSLTSHLATICTKIREFISYMPSADAVELLNSFEYLFDKSSTFYGQVLELRAEKECLTRELECVRTSTLNVSDNGKQYVAEELLNENLKFQEKIEELSKNNRELLDQIKTRDEALSKLNNLLQFAFPPTKNFQQQYNSENEKQDIYAYWHLNETKFTEKKGCGDQNKESEDVSYSCCDLTNFSTCESNDDKKDKKQNSLLVFADEYGKGFKSRLGDILNLVVKTVIKPGATLENAIRGFDKYCANFTKKDFVLVIAGSNNLISSIRARVNFGNTFYALMSGTSHTNLLVSTLPVPGENFTSKNYVSELVVLNKIIMTLAKEFYHVTVVRGLDLRYANFYYRFNTNKVKINVYIQEKIIAAFLKCLEAVRLQKPDANFLNLQYFNSMQYVQGSMTTEQINNWYYLNHRQSDQNSTHASEPPNEFMNQQNFTKNNTK